MGGNYNCLGVSGKVLGRDWNMGHPKRDGAVCRRTAHKAICANVNVNT